MPGTHRSALNFSDKAKRWRNGPCIGCFGILFRPVFTRIFRERHRQDVRVLVCTVGKVFANWIYIAMTTIIRMSLLPHPTLHLPCPVPVVYRASSYLANLPVASNPTSTTPTSRQRRMGSLRSALYFSSRISLGCRYGIL